jgi:hypothetical protein
MTSSITNFTKKNTVDQGVYDSFNKFIFSNDIKVLGKLLYRFKFFEMVKDLPGDAVEIGVFKGSGMATFQKFNELFCPNSIKKVVGFDIFDATDPDTALQKDNSNDISEMKKIYERVDASDLSLEAVQARLDGMNLSSNCILVKGDVETSIPAFLAENPGFRISLLYLDADLERPTYVALSHLWDRIVPGGLIVFDEFEYHKFSEAPGFEKFAKERGIQCDVRSTNFMSPTAFIVKNK